MIDIMSSEKPRVYSIMNIVGYWTLLNIPYYVPIHTYDSY